MEKISTKKIGNEGENRACNFLLQNGYEIIETPINLRDCGDEHEGTIFKFIYYTPHNKLE